MIVLMTVRSSHIQLADQIMVLEQGKLSRARKPLEIILQIMMEA